MSKFQIILLGVFGFFILCAVLIFALARGSGSVQASLTIWGPFSPSDFGNSITATGLTSQGYSVAYTQTNPATFDTDFTSALAENRGPDLIVVAQNSFWQEKAKLSLIPYTSINQADYQNAFTEEGSLFTTPNGLYALPLIVDPLVLYSNQDLLDTAAIATPLKYWDEIYSYVDKLTQKDGAGNITQSALALGEAKNIPHAKEILSLLMLQAGTPITEYVNGGLSGALLNTYNLPTLPADAALDFYTQFANPAKPFYSWNRSLTDAETNFISGDSAFYIGFGSEYADLKQKNPNLNISVSPVPQSRASGKNLTFATMYGIAVVKNSPNQQAALAVATALIGQPSVAALSKATGLPPARRDLLSSRPSDAVNTVLYTAALQSRGWIDPNSDKTRTLFTNLIESVTSGRANISTALSSANNSLNSSIKTP
jgi:ABC-type glycerol-3-phosphate transport system substrate-binding protein